MGIIKIYSKSFEYDFELTGWINRNIPDLNNVVSITKGVVGFHLFYKSFQVIKEN